MQVHPSKVCSLKHSVSQFKEISPPFYAWLLQARPESVTEVTLGDQVCIPRPLISSAVFLAAR